MSRKDSGTKQGESSTNSIEGQDGNSFEQIYYDAIKEFEWFKPLNGATREEKLMFFEDVERVCDYHQQRFPETSPITWLNIL
jgi:hypothetical protein